jgi:hypothetical protein
MRTNPFPFLRVSPFLHLPTRRYSQRLDATAPSTNRLGTAQWILSRPFYRFRRFDLMNIPKAQRTQALRLQIRQWSPYSRPGQYVVWGQDHALVWAWDADRLETDLAAQKLKPESTRVIPEGLLHPPLLSGLRLAACLDGVEGQFWQEQRPVHSRWWPEPPSATEWLNFQRDAGIAPDQGAGVPAPQTVPWLKQPWAKTAELGRGEGHALPQEIWLIGGAILLLAGFTTWYGIELIKTRQAVGQLKTQLAEAGQNARPLLEARRGALDALARIEALQATNPYPAQLAILAEVAKQLPKDGAYLKEWDYQNGKLKMTVASTNKLSSSFLVKKLQDAGWFRNVQAAPSNDPTTLTLTMETLLQSEIRVQMRDADGQGGADKMENAVDAVKSSPKT